MFIQAKEEKVASTMIPYVAEILSNMFREIEYNNQDRMIESVSQSLISTIGNPFVQMAFSLFIIVCELFLKSSCINLLKAFLKFHSFS